MNYITIISSHDDKKYFFTTDHCQNHGLGKNYVPCTYTLPLRTMSEKVQDRIIRTVQDLITAYYFDMQEIDNPDVTLQPSEKT